MKVEGPNRTSGPKSTSKTPKKGGDGTFGAMVDDAEGTGLKSSVAPASPIGALDALFMLQGSEDSTSEAAAKKAKKRAAELLDQLDRIKVGLLTGELSKSTIQQLSRTVSSHREAVMDPKLSEILDEIDLRAQIELAKLDM